MSWVIRYTEDNKFIQIKKNLPYWVDAVALATMFDSEADAKIEIKRRGIPYCKAKEVSKRDR